MALLRPPPPPPPIPETPDVLFEGDSDTHLTRASKY